MSAEQKKPRVFHLVNMTRSPHTRTRRASAPQHNRFVQRLVGGKFIIRRSRPTVISEKTLMEHLAIVKAVEAQGVLEVRTPAGQKVNLATFEVAPLSVAPPKPNFPLDSVVRDKPGPAQGLPLFEDGRLPEEAIVSDTLFSAGEEQEAVEEEELVEFDEPAEEAEEAVEAEVVKAAAPAPVDPSVRAGELRDQCTKAELEKMAKAMGLDVSGNKIALSEAIAKKESGS